MRRSGFTMVELIFVIIIIGILGVAAIPKFGDIKERAKVNSEYSALSGIDTAIVAAMEFQRADNNNVYVDWHEKDLLRLGDPGDNPKDFYKVVNTDKSVLSRVVKNSEDLQIVAFAEAGATYSLIDGIYDDILFLEGKASSSSIGAKEADSAGALNGKPDKNDVWAVNLSPHDATIYFGDGSTVHSKKLGSGEIALIDLTVAPQFTGATRATSTAGEISVNGTKGTDPAQELSVTLQANF